MNKTKKISALLCFIITIFLLLLQLVYIIIVKPQGYLYLHGLSALIISIFTIVFAIFPLLTLMKNAKKRWILAIIILLVNLLHIFMGSDLSSTSIVSYGKNITRPFAVKAVGQNIFIIENPMLLYGKLGNAAAIPMKDEYDITWLTKNTSVFTYRGIDDKLHVYVASHGDAGRGSYFNVAPEIQGTWKSGKEQWIIGTNSLKIKNNEFDFSQIAQVGQSAIILNNSFNHPQYIIALGDNFSFTKDGYAKKGSDIVLWEVSFDKKPITYTKISK